MSKETKKKTHDDQVREDAFAAIKEALKAYKSDSVWRGQPRVDHPVDKYHNKEAPRLDALYIERDHEEDGVKRRAGAEAVASVDARNYGRYGHSSSYAEAKGRFRLKVGYSYDTKDALKWRKAENAEQFAERAARLIVEKLADAIHSQKATEQRNRSHELREEVLETVREPVKEALEAAGVKSYGTFVGPAGNRYGHKTKEIRVSFDVSADEAVEVLGKLFGIEFDQ